ncbi:MAG: sulfotransferase [Cyanobacteria bacterium J06560_2]
MKFDKQLICVSGLPRSGSTLLCQLLSHHSELYCPGHSSPLCHALVGLRTSLSQNDFLKAQLDVDFDLVYQRLGNASRGFMQGWFAETEQARVVDKNRGWLHHIEFLHALVPDFRMLVCVRELGQVYGSVEAQHQKTILLDFPDQLAQHSRYGRADKLFGNGGVIGSPLQSIGALQDIDAQLQQHLYYVVFEHLMQDPVSAMQGVFDWLALPRAEIDPQNLRKTPNESDSYYRFKYLHTRHSKIQPPKTHDIPPRIQQQIQQQFSWYYQTFYPGIISRESI